MSILATTLAFKLSAELCYNQTAWTRQPILATTLTVFSRKFWVDRQCGPDPRPPMPKLWHSSFPQNYVTVRRTIQPILATTLTRDFFVCRQTAWTRSMSTHATTLAFKLSTELCYSQTDNTTRPCHNSDKGFFLCRQTAWTRSTSTRVTTLTVFSWEFFVDRQCGPDPCPPAPQRGQPRVRHRPAQAQEAARAQSW
jgi:hypothetical protein